MGAEWLCFPWQLWLSPAGSSRGAPGADEPEQSPSAVRGARGGHGFGGAWVSVCTSPRAAPHPLRHRRSAVERSEAEDGLPSLGAGRESGPSPDS